MEQRASKLLKTICQLLVDNNNKCLDRGAAVIDTLMGAILGYCSCGIWPLLTQPSAPNVDLVSTFLIFNLFLKSASPVAHPMGQCLINTIDQSIQGYVGSKIMRVVSSKIRTLFGRSVTDDEESMTRSPGEEYDEMADDLLFPWVIRQNGVWVTLQQWAPPSSLTATISRSTEPNLQSIGFGPMRDLIAHMLRGKDPFVSFDSCADEVGTYETKLHSLLGKSFGRRQVKVDTVPAPSTVWQSSFSTSSSSQATRTFQKLASLFQLVFSFEYDAFLAGRWIIGGASGTGSALSVIVENKISSANKTLRDCQSLDYRLLNYKNNRVLTVSSLLEDDGEDAEDEDGIDDGYYWGAGISLPQNSYDRLLSTLRQIRSFCSYHNLLSRSGPLPQDERTTVDADIMEMERQRRQTQQLSKLVIKLQCLYAELFHFLCIAIFEKIVYACTMSARTLLQFAVPVVLEELGKSTFTSEGHVLRNGMNELVLKVSLLQSAATLLNSVPLPWGYGASSIADSADAVLCRHLAAISWLLPGVEDAPRSNSDVADPEESGMIRRVHNGSYSYQFGLPVLVDDGISQCSNLLGALDLLPKSLQASVAASTCRLPVFVLNLNRRIDRWQSLINTVDAAHMCVIRVVAVDAACDKDGIAADDVKVSWNSSLFSQFDASCTVSEDITMSTSERCCAASHLAVWRRIAALRTSLLLGKSLSSPGGVGGSDAFSNSDLPSTITGTDKVGTAEELVVETFVSAYLGGGWKPLDTVSSADKKRHHKSERYTDVAKKARGPQDAFARHTDENSKDLTILDNEDEDWYLICEDDVQFIQNTTAMQSSVAETLTHFIRDKVPGDFDICFVHNSVPSTAKQTPFAGGLVVQINYSAMMCAYVLRGRAVSKLLSKLPISAPIDIFVSELMYDGDIKAYAITQPTVRVNTSLSSDVIHSGRVAPGRWANPAKHSKVGSRPNRSFAGAKAVRFSADKVKGATKSEAQVNHPPGQGRKRRNQS
jgi:GR25 family glycosyltransferase involved in LPS biosynthesis